MVSLRKFTIQDMQKLAESHDGKCLSLTYKNVNIPLTWKCENSEHPSWNIPANNIIKGSWCPNCRLDRFIVPLKSKIIENKGQWISGKYINSYTKIKVKCEKNHTWYAKPASIVLGHWCKRCAHDRKKERTLIALHNMVKEKRGEILSKRYDGSIGKVKFKCQYGHVFYTTQSKISQGHWCLKCAVKEKLGDITDIKKIAKNRGGECLSNTYKGAHHKLKFRCINEHIWYAKPNAIKNGTWCPKCNSPVGENLVRLLLEQVFQKKFLKSYPKWLKSNEGTQLELDGYNEKIGIAFEHQGIHHFERKGLYARNFKRRQELDCLKRDLCIKNNVLLIEIKQAGEKRSLSEIKDDLYKECQRLNIKLPENYNDITLDANKAFVKNENDILNTIKEIAKNKGGKCLSSGYGGHYYKLEFECSNKHRWFTDPATIKRGRWCPACAKQNSPGRKPKYNLDDMIALAKNKGGKCLSNEFKNVTTKLKWECKNGHQWESAPSSILGGSWCKSCAATERNLRRYSKQ